MKILVENKLIETRDIVNIDDSGNRKHGFIIYLIDGSKVKIQEHEQYEMTNHQLGNINDKYRRLENKVREYWEKDKLDIPILTL